jgi:hypothetical protein
MGDPRCRCAIQNCAGPGIDMDDETLSGDLGRIYFAAPIVGIRHMEAVEPNDDVRFGFECLRERDFATGFLSAFLQGRVVNGAEFSVLEIALFGGDI